MYFSPRCVGMFFKKVGREKRKKEMVGQMMMSEAVMARIVADHALCPQHESVRVMELTYLSEEPFGGRDNVRMNPFLTGNEPLWPLDKARANHLAMYRCLLFLGVKSTNNLTVKMLHYYISMLRPRIDQKTVQNSTIRARQSVACFCYGGQWSTMEAMWFAVVARCLL